MLLTSTASSSVLIFFPVNSLGKKDSIKKLYCIVNYFFRDDDYRCTHSASNWLGVRMSAKGTTLSL